MPIRRHGYHAFVDNLSGPIVSSEWLLQHLSDPDLRVLDATVQMSPPSSQDEGWTVRADRDGYDASHIPGAQFADLVSDFSGPVGRFPRPELRQFVSSLERFGIGPNSKVVIYDRTSTMWAARLWWVFRSYGLDQAAVLNGGFTAWQAEGMPTTREPASPVTADPFIPRERPRLFADRHDVLAIVENGEACLISALDAGDFRATRTDRYARPGRIPGSLNVPASGVFGADGRLSPISVLAQRFAPALVRPGRKVTYCGSGIAASLDALVLTLLGEEDVAVYDASMEEWAADPSLPMEVGQGSESFPVGD
jgi:thiosulfate/3-mercaptopyruvate sulfurtransferase